MRQPCISDRCVGKRQVLEVFEPFQICEARVGHERSVEAQAFSVGHPRKVFGARVAPPLTLEIQAPKTGYASQVPHSRVAELCVFETCYFELIEQLQSFVPQPFAHPVWSPLPRLSPPAVPLDLLDRAL